MKSINPITISSAKSLTILINNEILMRLSIRIVYFIAICIFANFLASIASACECSSGCEKYIPEIKCYANGQYLGTHCELIEIWDRKIGDIIDLEITCVNPDDKTRRFFAKRNGEFLIDENLSPNQKKAYKLGFTLDQDYDQVDVYMWEILSNDEPVHVPSPLCDCTVQIHTNPRPDWANQAS